MLGRFIKLFLRIGNIPQNNFQGSHQRTFHAQSQRIFRRLSGIRILAQPQQNGSLVQHAVRTAVRLILILQEIVGSHQGAVILSERQAHLRQITPNHLLHILKLVVLRSPGHILVRRFQILHPIGLKTQPCGNDIRHTSHGGRIFLLQGFQGFLQFIHVLELVIGQDGKHINLFSVFLGIQRLGLRHMADRRLEISLVKRRTPQQEMGFSQSGRRRLRKILDQAFIILRHVRHILASRINLSGSLPCGGS